MLGFLNINKPTGMTSHDVISVLRKITKIKQIGHTGTLDPMAKGVLPVAVSKASRLIEYLSEDKGYIAELRFGSISDTYDSEGGIQKFSDKILSKEELETHLEYFNGEIEQIPPAHSAVHYKGKRLYELARKGEIPEDIPKRKITIYNSKLLDFNEENQTAKLLIQCSKGTYIRSIVNDLGMMCETGAYMNGLTRIKSGLFLIENSIELNDIKDISDVEKNLINPLDVLCYNCYNLTDIEYEKIICGQTINTKGDGQEGIKVLTYNSQIAAIGEQDGRRLRAKKVFLR